MFNEIEFKKYQERGACHVKEIKRSIFYFNAAQQARYDLILKHLGNIERKTVLDLGCGDGALTHFICQKKLMLLVLIIMSWV